MIIGFYPGAGGNRYLRYINNLEYSRDNISYDKQNVEQRFDNRYLLNELIQDSKLVLTHCLNATRIRSFAPDAEITFIVSDLKKSLHREWQLEGHAHRYVPVQNDVNVRIEHYNAIRDSTWPVVTTVEDFTKLPNSVKAEVDAAYAEIDAVAKEESYQRLQTAFATIDWHHNYYKTYPVEHSNATIIDIDTDNTEFTQVMRRQLNVNVDPWFELAWDSFKEFGSNAPLTEIYERAKK